MRRYAYLILACVLAVLPQSVWAQRGEKWVVSWTGSAQGPYPIGNPSAQPDQKFAFPTPDTGARDQTFRLILRPDLWGRQARLRLTNVFGTKPVTFDGVFVGLQVGGAAVAKATNRPVTFGSKTSVTVAPGASVWSDAVALGFVRNPAESELAGRKVTNPASEQAVIERWNVERALEKQIPQIHQQRRADADGDSTHDAGLSVHHSSLSRLPPPASRVPQTVQVVPARNAPRHR